MNPPQGLGVNRPEVVELTRNVALGALVLLALTGLAQTGVSPLGLVPQPVPGLSAAIWTDKPQYAIGETARVHFYISQPAYVYIFDIEPTGLVRLIFPNPYSPNPYKPAGTHTLPDNASYQYRVAPPAGQETLQLVACLQPLPVTLGTTADPYPLMGPDPSSGKAKVLGLVPQPGCGCCVTAWTTFTILSGPVGYPPCPPCWGWQPCPPCWGYGLIPPCSGWFCNLQGQCQFFYGECPAGPGWCWYLGPDGKWQFKIQLCFGNCP